MTEQRCEELAARLPGAKVNKDGNWSDVGFGRYVIQPMTEGCWDIWPEGGGEHPLEIGLTADEVVDMLTDAEYEQGRDVTLGRVIHLLQESRKLKWAYVNSGHAEANEAMNRVITTLFGIRNELLVGNQEFVPTVWEAENDI